MEKLILKIQQVLLLARIVVLCKDYFLWKAIYNGKSARKSLDFWVESHTKEGDSPVSLF